MTDDGSKASESADSVESAAGSATVATRSTDARATPPGLDFMVEREMRIERIADLMRAGEWIRSRSGKDLAQELGLAYQTIRLDAAIASKRVYAEVMGDREGIGAQVGHALQTALDGALREGNYKAVAALAKVYADASGVSAPTRQELTGKDGAPLGPVICVPPESDD